VTLIAGRYQPLEPGASGTRVRARDLQTAQTVILRDIRLPQGSEDAARTRAEAARGIFHPSLVTLFDVFVQPEGRLLLAYEFVPAQSAAAVSGGHPFNARRAAAIVVEVADAVAELHAHGVSHGGISQGTVLITMKGKAKLDRTGDPTLHVRASPTPESDLQAIADLLVELVGNTSAAGPAGREVATIIARLRRGQIDAPATLAAALRAVSG
jgi:serine/threonine protein kinase